MRWISSFSEKPVHHRPRILATQITLTDAKWAHLSLALHSRLREGSLRESCIRENRTCSLSGGRWPARKRASSDPAPMNHSNNERTGEWEGKAADQGEPPSTSHAADT